MNRKKNNRQIGLLAVILVFLIGFKGISQSWQDNQYPKIHIQEWQEMNQSKEKTKEWLNDAKYGMFIHWGLYSIPGGIWKGKKIHEMRPPHIAEWIMYAAEIPRKEYAELAKEFNPTKFDADEVVKLAKDAGMKYIVITAKHHDGFAMFDSKVSNYDIIDNSPYKQDIIKELHDACEKQGMAFGVYYSHNIDWEDGSDAQVAITSKQHPEFSEHFKTFGANTWDTSPNSFDDYLQNKALPQVSELMTNYPDMKLLWYDMPWRMTDEQSYDFYKIVYDIQPQILINERIGNGFGDFNVPGDNKIPTEHKNMDKPWQTVGTFNNSWGYNSYDHDWKSPEEVLYWLVEIVSKGGNYMLNIGPTGEGVVPKESVANLKAIGKWLLINGEAIYGTQRWEISREGPTSLNFSSTEDRAEKGFQFEFTSKDFWFTKKEKTVYAISLNNKERKILIKSLPKTKQSVNSVQLLGSDNKLKWHQNKEGLHIVLPKNLSTEIGYALKIKLD